MQCSIQRQMGLCLFDIFYFRPQMRSITRRTDDDVYIYIKKAKATKAANTPGYQTEWDKWQYAD